MLVATFLFVSMAYLLGGIAYHADWHGAEPLLKNEPRRLEPILVRLQRARAGEAGARARQQRLHLPRRLHDVIGIWKWLRFVREG